MEIRKNFLLVSLLLTLFAPLLSFSQQRQSRASSDSENSQWKEGVELNNRDFKWVILEHKGYSFLCYGEMSFPEGEDRSRFELKSKGQSTDTFQIKISFTGQFFSCYPYKEGERSLIGKAIAIGIGSDFIAGSFTLEPESVTCGTWASLIERKNHVKINSSRHQESSFDLLSSLKGESLLDMDPMSLVGQRGIESMEEKPWHPLPPLPWPLMEKGREFLDLKEPAFCIVTK